MDGVRSFILLLNEKPFPALREPMDFDLTAFEEELEYLVNIDSGSRCLDGVEKVTDWFSSG